MNITEWCSDKAKFLDWCKKQNIYQVVKRKVPCFPPDRVSELPIDLFSYNRGELDMLKWHKQSLKPVSKIIGG